MLGKLGVNLVFDEQLESIMKGSTHFRHQRLTALALVVLLFTMMVLGPMSIASQGFVLIVVLYHGLLGMEMVIEDYTRTSRALLILLVRLVTVFLIGVVCWRVGSLIF